MYEGVDFYSECCLPRGTKKGLSISPPDRFHKLAPGWLHRGRGGFKLSGMLEEVSLNTSANFGAFVIRNTEDTGGAIWPPPPPGIGLIYSYAPL